MIVQTLKCLKTQNEIIGYEVGVLVDYDEDANNWVIKKSDNEGKLILDGQSEVVEEEDKDSFPF